MPLIIFRVYKISLILCFMNRKTLKIITTASIGLRAMATSKVVEEILEESRIRAVGVKLLIETARPKMAAVGLSSTSSSSSKSINNN